MVQADFVGQRYFHSPVDGLVGVCAYLSHLGDALEINKKKISHRLV